ncbi:hypothetical protein F4777DRAFT_135040 [Nemania sp. FL0916]|nr:hypothetical protein F4777DRAFT_135040 [Nemania sp. FL0916]
MSATDITSYGGHCKLDQLPVELVVQIMLESHSLSTLYSLICASARLASVFRGSAVEITKGVMQRTVPAQMRIFLRAVIQLRSSPFPLILNAGLAKQSTRLCSHLGCTPASTPEILRSFICLAHRIHVLAHECIDHYRRVCIAMNPSCLDDPTFRGYDGTLVVQTVRPRGKPYQPKDTGPPSWAEEQLVLLNLWRVQYYYEIRVAHQAGRLEWPAVTPDELLSMDIAQFYGREMSSWRWEQLITIMIYMQQVKSSKQGTSRPFCLPSPSAPGRFDWPCSPEPLIDPLDEQASRLDFRSDAFIFMSLMSNDLKGSPLFGFRPSNFRKFGFVLWERRRMVDLGLLSPKTRLPDFTYYFKWVSILSEEERDRKNADHAFIDRVLSAMV